MSSLCFQEASIKRNGGKISEDEYMQAIVQHCTGVWHGSNKMCNDGTTELPQDLSFGHGIENDPFATAMASWIWLYFNESPTRVE